MPSVRRFALGTRGVTRYGADTMQGRLTGGLRINVLGEEAVLAKFRAVDLMVRRDLGLIMFRNANYVKITSQSLAPINKRPSPTKGALKRGHYIEKKAPYVYNVVVDTSSETGRDYGGYQEHGYHDRGGNFHPGRKFLTRATAAGAQKVKVDLAALARKIEVL